MKGLEESGREHRTKVWLELVTCCMSRVRIEVPTIELFNAAVSTRAPTQLKILSRSFQSINTRFLL